MSLSRRARLSNGDDVEFPAYESVGAAPVSLWMHSFRRVKNAYASETAHEGVRLAACVQRFRICGIDSYAA